MKLWDGRSAFNGFLLGIDVAMLSLYIWWLPIKNPNLSRGEVYAWIVVYALAALWFLTRELTRKET